MIHVRDRSYDLRFTDNRNYLRVDVRGELPDSDTKIECWSEIIKYCRAIGATHLLVVIEGRGNDTLMEAYISSRGIVDLGLSGLKIAYVDHDPKNFENNQFGEKVASNRKVMAKVFTEVDPAITWLVGKK